MKISTAIEHWPFTRPFHITGHTFDGIDVLVVSVESNGLVGRAEAAGVYYRGETAASIEAQIHAVAARARDATRQDLLGMMSAGGARNALDCALWDLEAKQQARPAWQLAGIAAPRPILTTYTLGADTPAAMAQLASSFVSARMLKLKLLGDGGDAERISAVRAARPDAWMGVDANQGFTPDSYHALLPVLVGAGVELVEQPFPLGSEHFLDGLASPIPIAADESVQCRQDLDRVVGRVDVLNIKLDKCGGLTEGLALAAAARKAGLKLMVGNMVGTTLSAAPAFLLGQLCDFADLDGPIFLARDRAPYALYADGCIYCPEEAWGAATSLPLRNQ